MLLTLRQYTAGCRQLRGVSRPRGGGGAGDQVIMNSLDPLAGCLQVVISFTAFAHGGIPMYPLHYLPSNSTFYVSMCRLLLTMLRRPAPRKRWRRRSSRWAATRSPWAPTSPTPQTSTACSRRCGGTSFKYSDVDALDHCGRKHFRPRGPRPPVQGGGTADMLGAKSVITDVLARRC